MNGDFGDPSDGWMYFACGRESFRARGQTVVCPKDVQALIPWMVNVTLCGKQTLQM